MNTDKIYPKKIKFSRKAAKLAKKNTNKSLKTIQFFLRVLAPLRENALLLT